MKNLRETLSPEAAALLFLLFLIAGIALLSVVARMTGHKGGHHRNTSATSGRPGHAA